MQVGNAGHDDAAGRQHPGCLAHYPPGIDKVLQHVGEDDGVEGAGGKGNAVDLDVGGQDAVEAAAGFVGGLGHQFHAGDVMAASLQEPAQAAAGTADLEHAAALRRHQGGDLRALLIVIPFGPSLRLHGGARSRPFEGGVHPIPP